MDLSEYARYDAVGLAQLIRAGEVSARELAELALQGVEKVNPRLNAVIEVYRERAAALGDDAPAGPLGGVPFFVKDLACPEPGKLHEMGSRLAQGFVSPHAWVAGQARKRNGRLVDPDVAALAASLARSRQHLDEGMHSVDIDALRQTAAVLMSAA